MKKLTGVLLILVGIVLIIFSIVVLIRAFDMFSMMGSDAASIGYTIGNIIFPLLLTVTGRWIYRKGREFLKESSVNN